jgi:hypothetical protein
MGVFKAALGDFDSIDLSADTNSKLIAFATAGRLRGMRRLLVRAVELAFESKKQQINLEILSQAFQQVIYVGCPVTRNPFHVKFDEYPLIRAGEPYATGLGEQHGS